MAVRISVRNDYLRAMRALNDLSAKQLPFATAAALTDTAQAARAEVTAALPRIFDRPVPFTVNALGFKPATKADLTAEVFVRDIQGRYLLHEEIGGTRTPAENSRKPGAAFSEPGKVALDAYGNIPNGTIANLAKLSQAVASAQKLAEEARVAARERGKTSSFGRKGDADRALKRVTRARASLAAKLTGKGVEGSSIAYFKGAGPHGRGPGGFFQRLPDHKIARLTAFGATAHYHPIFRFEDRVRQVAAATFRVALIKRLREAMQTARP